MLLVMHDLPQPLSVADRVRVLEGRPAARTLERAVADRGAGSTAELRTRFPFLGEDWSWPDPALERRVVRHGSGRAGNG
ncbi:MAG TPA: hypothetical protein VMI52_10780 [Acetobacteraceae bacterium]|nr:hypothetical protein [Acetobacteraceae bacterium]